MTRQQRTALVTGASTGIGAACALYLVQRGWRVFAGVRKPADAERLQAEAGASLTPVFVDVTDADQIAAMAWQVGAAVGDGGLHGLVNNAGVAVAGPMEAVPLDDLRRQFEVNFFGHVAVTQAVLPLLRTARGRIIHMSSLSGRITPPFFGPYAASKHALEVFSEALRVELAPWGIRSIAIEPGSIITPIWDKEVAANRRMLEALPDDKRRLYEQYLAPMLDATASFGQRGIPAERVAKVVHRALTTPFPRVRYLVGLDAQVMARLNLITPPFIWDGIAAWVLRRMSQGH